MGAAAVAAIGSSPGTGIHTTALLRLQHHTAQQRQPHTATIALQRPIGVGVVSTGSGSVTPTLTATSSQQLSSAGAGATGNTTPIALAVANQQQGNVTGATATRGIVTPQGTIRTVVTGTTAGSPALGGHQIIMSQASGQPVTTASGAVTSVVSSGTGPTVTRQIVVSHVGGNAGAASGALRSGQILQVTGQGGQQQQIVVSQSGQIILNPSGAQNKQ